MYYFGSMFKKTGHKQQYGMEQNQEQVCGQSGCQNSLVGSVVRVPLHRWSDGILATDPNWHF